MKLGESLRRNSRLAAGIIVPLIFSSLGLGCRSANNGEIAPQILVVQTSGLSVDMRGKVISAARAWDDRFDCPRESISVVPLTDLQVTREQDRVLRTIETAFPGRIEIYPEDDEPNETISHAMSHACTPDEPRILEFPMPYGGGDIIGFKGLNVMVRLPDGEETMFTKIDEGMAERNAALLVPGYSVDHPGYFNVGILTLKYFPPEDETADDFAKNNDVPGVVKRILGLPAEHIVTGQDIEQVMILYQQTWDKPIN